ncbi:ribosome maturation protein RimP [Novosphingopyxis sp.]|uniref:ribosome maturation protein RimP n=1 Tax=Novosphingopyxis sp. TaxID=2709690 RepID=UPI003B5A48C0
MPDLEVLTALIAPEAEALGFDLVRVAWLGGDERILQIMAERPDTRQLGIDDCAKLSRRISRKFDALEEAGKDPIDGAYRLEVSSPGIDRPLTRLKDFSDWEGHEARVNLTVGVDGRKQLRGDLIGVEDGMIAIQDRKSGKLMFDPEHLHSAKLMLTDRLIAATAPIDAGGADEIEEIEDDGESED